MKRRDFLLVSAAGLITAPLKFSLGRPINDDSEEHEEIVLEFEGLDGYTHSIDVFRVYQQSVKGKIRPVLLCRQDQGSPHQVCGWFNREGANFQFGDQVLRVARSALS